MYTFIRVNFYKNTKIINQILIKMVEKYGRRKGGG
jgi:hypothetical protein